MASQESNIANCIMLALSPLGARLFKNVRGLFLTLDGKRKAAAGLQPNGSSDLIGWTEVIINDKKTCIFTAIEVKTERGKISTEQQKYIDYISNNGGIAFVARTTDEAIRKLKQNLASLSTPQCN